VWIHIWVLYSVPLVFMSVFVPVLYCFYCDGSVVKFEVECYDTSSIALFAKYCLGYSQSLVFPNEL
jgi:RsiW-degrading membrane proteinase PrsW (M82 family)